MTLLGIFQPDAPGNPSDLSVAEAALGRRVDIVNWFHRFSQPYRPGHVQSVIDHNAIPMLTWEPWAANLRQALNGTYDPVIRHFGAEIRKHQHGEKLFIRMAHEMNGVGFYPWQVPSNPGLYRDFWNRTAMIVKNRAPGVRWMWCVNRSYPGSTPIQALWPGEQHVDHVGIDSYNMPHVVGKWREPDELFGETLEIIRGLWDGPVSICETGCVADPRRPEWIKSLKQWSSENGIQWLVYFNAQGSSGDYRLSSEELQILGDDLDS